MAVLRNKRGSLKRILCPFSFFLFTFYLTLLFTFGLANAQDYSKFIHTSSKHASLGCNDCHRRADNSTRPSLPGHKACTGCHRRQFTTPNIPMCSICHENVNGNDPPRKAFPDRFKENFNVSFDHAQHMKDNARPKTGCIACHSSSLRHGEGLSIPAGLNAHAGCYSSHTPDAQSNGRDLGSCGVCHATKPFTRTPTDAPAYRIGFSHAQHSARQRLECSTCHNYTAGLAQRRQGRSPRAPEHFPAGKNPWAHFHKGRRASG